MASTFFGLTISYTGVQAAATSLNVVSHNIANINSESYSRQSVSTSAAKAIRTYSSYGTLGAGIVVDEITQARDSYYDNKYRSNEALYGEYEAKENYMGQIENYLDEFNLDGYCTEYQNFFTAVEAVIKTPGESSAKNQLVNCAQSFAQYFNTLSASLRKVQEDANNELKSVVSQINSIAENIASLNRQINQIEANYGNANDLRDQRNALVDELSGYVNVTTSEDDLGNGLTEYKVFINGMSLVSNYDYDTLETKARDEVRNASDAGGLYDIEWTSGRVFNIYSSSLSGEIKALIDIRDGCNNCIEGYATDDDGNYLTDADGNYYLETRTQSEYNTEYKGVPYYQSRLNLFISTFSEAVNSILEDGISSDGKYEGSALFVTQNNTSVMTALNVTVNKDIIDNVNKLATRTDITTGEAEAGIMERLRLLQTTDIFDGGNPEYFLESIVSDMTIDTSNATTLFSNYTSLKTSIQNQRLSVMGTDTDEEAMDMVKYQQAYNLNCKMMSVMNEIYDKLINGTGV
jgi:flagellar hook-associated protein 1 FlgK